MSRVLLVSNDFPPRRGGIQSYLQNLVDHLVAAGTHTLTVYAPKWKGADDFDRDAGYEVVRHPGTLMLPVPHQACTLATGALRSVCTIIVRPSGRVHCCAVTGGNVIAVELPGGAVLSRAVVNMATSADDRPEPGGS